MAYRVNINLDADASDLENELNRISRASREQEEANRRLAQEFSNQRRMLDELNSRLGINTREENQMASTVERVTREYRNQESVIGNIQSEIERSNASQRAFDAQTANLFEQSYTRSINAIRESLTNAIRNGSTSGIRFFQNELSSMRGIINSVFSSLSSSGFTTQANNIRNTFMSAISSIGSEIRSLIERSSGTIKEVVNNIGSVARRTVSKTADSAKKIFSSLASFIKDNMRGIFSSKNTGLDTMKGQIASLTAGYASLYGLIRLSKSAIEYSSSIIEVQNVIDNVFKETSKSVDEFCDNAINKFGLTSLEAKKMIGVFGGMLGASDITGEAQSEMSKNLTALVADVSSFYNMDFDETFAKFQSGLAGNVMAMRSLGINMTKANLNAYALSKGITVAYKDMNQASQATLRYNYMLEKLQVAQGDYARTSMTWANTVRNLQVNFQQLLATLGGGLIKILYPVVQTLNTIVVYANKGAQALAKLFGFDVKGLENMYGGAGQTADLSGLSSGLDDYSDSLSGVSDATDDVAESTKKANDNLQSFDKLNNMVSDTNDKASKSKKGGVSPVGGASIIDPLSYYGNIGDVERNATKFEKFLDSFIKKLKKKDFEGAGKQIADGINSIVDALDKKLTNDKLYKNMDKITSGLSEFLDGFSKSIKGFNVGKALQDILFDVSYFIDSLYEKLADKGTIVRLGKQFGAFMNGVFQDADKWYSIGKAVATKTRVIIDYIYGAIKEFDPVKAGNALRAFFGGVLDRTFGSGGAEEISYIIYTGLNKAFDFVNSTFGDGKIVSQLCDNLLKVINTAIGGIDSNKLADALGTVLRNATKVLTTISEIDFNGLIDKIANGINTAAENGDLQRFIESATKIAMTLFDAIGEAITKLDWGSIIKSIFNGIKDGVTDEDADGASKALAGALGVGLLANIPLKLVGISGAFRGIKKVAGSALSIVGSFVGSLASVSTASGTITGTLGGATTSLSAFVGTVATLLGGIIVSFGLVMSGVEEFNSYMNKIDYEDLSNQTKDMDLFDYSSMDEYAEKLREVTLAYQDMDGSVSGFENYLEVLKRVGMEGSEQFNSLKQALDDYNNSSTFIGEGKALSEMEGIAGQIQGQVNSTMSYLSNMDKLTYETGNKVGTSYMSGVSNGVSTNSEAVKGRALDVIGTSTSSANVSAQTNGKEVGKNLANSVGNGVVESKGNVLNSINSTVSSAVNASGSSANANATTIGKNITSSVGNGVSSNGGMITNSVSNTVSSALRNSSNDQSSANNVGRNIVLGIDSGINNNKSTLFSSIANIGRSLLDSFKSALGIHSPSREFASLAEFIPDGIAMGIDGNTESAIKAIDGVSSKLSDKFENTDLNLEAMMSGSKFDGLFKNMDRSADIALQSLSDKFSAFTNGINLNKEMVITPKVDSFKMSAIKAQSASTSDLSSIAKEISHNVRTNGNSSNARYIPINVYLDKNNKLESFLIDTINGEKIRSGAVTL